jgi:hypothetical protein
MAERSRPVNTVTSCARPQISSISSVLGTTLPCHDFFALSFTRYYILRTFVRGCHCTADTSCTICHHALSNFHSSSGAPNVPPCARLSTLQLRIFPLLSHSLRPSYTFVRDFHPCFLLIRSSVQLRVLPDASLTSRHLGACPLRLSMVSYTRHIFTAARCARCAACAFSIAPCFSSRKPVSALAMYRISITSFGDYAVLAFTYCLAPSGRLYVQLNWVIPPQASNAPYRASHIKHDKWRTMGPGFASSLRMSVQPPQLPLPLLSSPTLERSSHPVNTPCAWHCMRTRHLASAIAAPAPGCRPPEGRPDRAIIAHRGIELTCPAL